MIKEGTEKTRIESVEGTLWGLTHLDVLLIYTSKHTVHCLWAVHRTICLVKSREESIDQLLTSVFITFPGAQEPEFGDETDALPLLTKASLFWIKGVVDGPKG